MEYKQKILTRKNIKGKHYKVRLLLLGWFGFPVLPVWSGVQFKFNMSSLNRHLLCVSGKRFKQGTT